MAYLKGKLEARPSPVLFGAALCGRLIGTCENRCSVGQVGCISGERGSREAVKAISGQLTSLVSSSLTVHRRVQAEQGGSALPAPVTPPPPPPSPSPLFGQQDSS